MKYIIEFEDEPCMREDGLNFYKCIQAPWWVLSERVIKQLTPYQPDAPDTNVGNITNLCAHEKDHNADIGKKAEKEDCISRQAAIDTIMGQPPEPHYPSWYAAQIEKLPAAQPATNCSEIPNGSDDTISRQAAIDALARMMPRSYTPDGSHPADEEIFQAQEVFADCIEALEILPSAQPTLCGYNIEHLILIANVLRKENLPPERVVEALTDIGRIVSIVKDEFEESLRKAVEQCKV